ncbi:hypothetical protein [Pseudoalteromonas sp. Of7M-16]|uniref:hypothetical protein n=1 Tax=Pseudoalteromonas sp. Of7M-16 TaxID=2917756 RepID=UPI001EF42F82|nr:hypothetical protein [Pseudoalteromonas sp. Of7M-16]MCG7550041.1 hypothetical protein [Pseudoalteromonas sp. Of7M-16]
MTAYYHYTTLSLAEKIKDGGLSTNYFRTNKKRATAGGSFDIDKAENFDKRVSSQLNDFASFIARETQSNDPMGLHAALVHLAKEQAELLESSLALDPIQLHKQYLMNLECLLEQVYHTSAPAKNMARELALLLLKIEVVDKISHSSLFKKDMVASTKRFTLKPQTKKALAGLFLESENHLYKWIKALALAYTKFYYDSEEIVCSTHIYFFDRHRAENEGTDYIKRLRKFENDIVILKVDLEAEEVILDEAQGNAFMAVPQHIQPSKIDFQHIASNETSWVEGGNWVNIRHLGSLYAI